MRMRPHSGHTRVAAWDRLQARARASCPSRAYWRLRMPETIRAVRAWKRRVPPDRHRDPKHVADDALTEREIEIVRRSQRGSRTS